MIVKRKKSCLIGRTLRLALCYLFALQAFAAALSTASATGGAPTAGIASIITMSLVTSLVQLVAPDHLRGRVMSIYMVAFRGGMPLGSLVSGALVARLGLPVVLTLNGLLLCAAAAYFLTRKDGVIRI